ncbi:MAG: phage tail protein [Neobacillus sp.]|nr:phage tail protein [Neobacillus sp.]
MATISLDKLVYALVTKDDETGYTTGPVKTFAPAMSANVNRNSSSTSLSADNGVKAIATSTGDTELELGTSSIPLPVQAEVLGHELRAGVLIRKKTDKAPYIAVGFRSENDDNSDKLVWLYKGKFQVPGQEFATKGESVEFQTRTITGKFASRDFDGTSDIEADTNNEAIPPAVITNWFNEVVDLADLTTTP